MPRLSQPPCLAHIQIRTAINKKKRKSEQPQEEKTIDVLNNQIQSREVRVTDHNEQYLGIIPLEQALKAARDAKLDLIQISPSRNNNPAVCRIVDYKKFKYHRTQKEKEIRAKNQVERREIRIGHLCAQHDLQIKLKKVREFIAEGATVVVQIETGRAPVDPSIFSTKLLEVASMIADVATHQPLKQVEEGQPPVKQLIFLPIKTKKGKEAKPQQQQQQQQPANKAKLPPAPTPSLEEDSVPTGPSPGPHAAHQGVFDQRHQQMASQRS